MSDWSDITAARAALAQPGLSAADLGAITQAQPSLGAEAAAHPAAYPELLDWLGRYGDDRAKAAVAWRTSAPPAPAAPVAAATVAAAPVVQPAYPTGYDPAQPAYAPAPPGYGAQPGYPPGQPGYGPAPVGYGPAQVGYGPPAAYRPQRNSFVFVMSILALIMGPLAGIAAIFNFSNADYYRRVLDIPEPLTIAIACAGLVVAVVAIVSGILGIKNASRPDQAGLLVTLGIAMVALTLLILVLNLLSLGFTTSAFGGPLIPILYLVAASRFKSAGR
jgi:hypothetical protein